MNLETVIYPHFTGNPFVDAGIAALCALNQKNEPKQINKADLTCSAEYIAELYPNWVKLGNLFTRNCTLLNPSISNRVAKYKEDLNKLLDKISPASVSGSCAACGVREADTFVYRDRCPLTGSGDLVNYFSFFEPGFPVCAACAFAVQFTPLYLISNNGKLFLAHSHNTRIMLNLARKTISHAKGLAAAGAKLSYYLVRFSKNDPYECVVNLARELILEAESQIGPTAIRLYGFMNSGQLNLLDSIDLPTEVFSFIEQARLLGLNRKLDELLDNSPRTIYHRLVMGESIGNFFLRLKEKKIAGGWELFELYLQEVEKMDKERLEAIKKIGENLYSYLKKNNFKRLTDLEQAIDKGFTDFLAVLTRIQKEATIWEADDYPDLFPQDAKGAVSWRETALVLLGYIYQLKNKEEK